MAGETSAGEIGAGITAAMIEALNARDTALAARERVKASLAALSGLLETTQNPDARASLEALELAVGELGLLDEAVADARNAAVEYGEAAALPIVLPEI